MRGQIVSTLMALDCSVATRTISSVCDTIITSISSGTQIARPSTKVKLLFAGEISVDEGHVLIVRCPLGSVDI